MQKQCLFCLCELRKQQRQFLLVRVVWLDLWDAATWPIEEDWTCMCDSDGPRMENKGIFHLLKHNAGTKSFKRHNGYSKVLHKRTFGAMSSSDLLHYMCWKESPAMRLTRRGEAFNCEGFSCTGCTAESLATNSTKLVSVIWTKS